MNLEDMSAAVRPRSQWEAIDLGLRMARAHFRPMFLSSVALTLPLFLVLQLVFWKEPLLGGLALWWLKPLWERVHLHILSRSLFGESPGVRETLAEFPRYGFKQWLPWLTIRRLVPTRSLDLPVTQLEDLSGPRRSKRIELLRQGPSASGAFWLLIVGAHIEGFIYLSALLLAQLLVPQNADVDLLPWFVGWGAEDGGPVILQNLLALLGALLVAPFYVAGGFGLYVNRRTILEGWDLEIRFRRLVERLETRRQGRPVAGAAASLIALVITGLGVWAPQTSAAEPTFWDENTGRFEPLDPPSARESIETVLNGNAFHQIETRRVPRFSFESEPAEGDSNWLLGWIERFFAWLDTSDDSEPSKPPTWLTDLLTWLPVAIAQASEALLIAGLLLVVLYILYRYRDTLIRAAGELAPALAAKAPRPSVLMGMEVTRESLPDDIVAAVREAWRAGQPRVACSLLYRATLTELMSHHAVELHPSFTERDCLHAATPVLSDRHSDYFTDLTRQWQLLAYAHRAPSDATMETLCASWTQLFAAAPAGAGARDVT